jgi:hypothetical protein
VLKRTNQYSARRSANERAELLERGMMDDGGLEREEPFHSDRFDACQKGVTFRNNSTEVFDLKKAGHLSITTASFWGFSNLIHSIKLQILSIKIRKNFLNV